MRLFFPRRIMPLLALLFTAIACEEPGDGDAPLPGGSYELTATMGDQQFPVRLDLIEVDDRPWGRLVVVAGAERVVAVRGVDDAGTEWEFAAGGPVAGVRLRLGDTISGTLSLAGGPAVPLEGRRVGDVEDAEDLRAQHVLEPLGLAARAGEEGASFPTLTPEGELIFARHGSDLSHQTLMIAVPDGDEGWRDPRVLPFSGTHSDRSPAMLPDGSGLVFASDRPVPGAAEEEAHHLWFVPRSTSGEWGTPSQVEFPGGWEADARQPSVAADGTLYFSSDAANGHGEGDIYRSAPQPSRPGEWGAPRNLGEPINGPGDEHGAFIAPDGSFLLLTSSGERPGRSGGDDLYLSRRNGDGWSTPQPLPLPVNTFANEYGAWLAAGDGLLYLTSDRYGHARLLRTDVRALDLAE